MAAFIAEEQEVVDTPVNDEQRKRLSTENIESQCDIPTKMAAHTEQSNEETAKESADGECSVAREKDADLFFKEIEYPPDLTKHKGKPSGPIQKVSKDFNHEAETQIKSELKKEVDRARRRFSSTGRERRSTIGQRSLCSSVLPLVSLEDQINNVGSDLPKASKVCHLLDITIRESLRRLSEALPSKLECVAALRHRILTTSEMIAGEISFKIAGQPLTLEKPLSVQEVENKEEPVHNQELIAAYKKKTEVLRGELKQWKTMKKERKQLCGAAERELEEAKNGETKIDEDHVKLSVLQRNILASRPNYHQYIQEVQTAREKNLLISQEVERVSQAVSKFITWTEALEESNFTAVERISFGHLKQNDAKKMLLSIAEPASIKISSQAQDTTVYKLNRHQLQ